MSCFLDPSKVHSPFWWALMELIRFVPSDEAECDTHHVGPDESRLSFISSPWPALTSSLIFRDRLRRAVRVAWAALLWISRAPLIFTRTPRLPAARAGAGATGRYSIFFQILTKRRVRKNQLYSRIQEWYVKWIFWGGKPEKIMPKSRVFFGHFCPEN